MIMSMVICGFCNHAVNADQTSNWRLLRTHSSEKDSEVDLTINGKLEGDAVRTFSLKTILQLPAVTFEVTHPVSGKKNTYTGVSLSELLTHLGVSSDAEYVVIEAANNYKAAVKINDIQRYDYLLSYKKNEKLYDELPPEQNRGPLAIAINFDKHPELEYDIYKHQLVWFVESLTVK